MVSAPARDLSEVCTVSNGFGVVGAPAAPLPRPPHQPGERC